MALLQKPFSFEVLARKVRELLDAPPTRPAHVAFAVQRRRAHQLTPFSLPAGSSEDVGAVRVAAVAA